MFITFEGVEGSGKTTIANAVAVKLKGAGHDVVQTREPGGVAIAEAIREVILNPDHTDMDAITETLLYAAARRQHLVDVILPALALKKIVLCDRFIDSTVAYQGVARGIDQSIIHTINDVATEGRLPDLTFFIDVTPQVGLMRIAQNKQREVNRLDLETRDFHEAVYKGYLLQSEKCPERISVVDGNRPVEAIASEVFTIIETRCAP